MRVRKVPIKTSSNPQGYVECLPNTMVTGKKYTTCFWLPGLGEVGDGSSSALDKIYNKSISAWAKNNDPDVIFLIPQDWSGYWAKIEDFIIWALGYYKDTIDVDSLHMGGLSSGGYGIRDFIIRNSDVYKSFATFTPMSTNLDAAIPKVWQIVDNKQWVWAHHGANDGGANMPGAVARFIKAGQQIAPERFMMTIYKGMGHSAWEEVYDASGRPTVEVDADTFEGAKLFKWVDEPKTWIDWLKSKRKAPVVVEPEPPAPDPEPEPIPVVENIVSEYIVDGYRYTVTDRGNKYKSGVTKV